MKVDYDKNEISFEDCLILKNDDTAITISGNGIGKMKVNMYKITFACRTNKSKILTKLKWIKKVIQYKL